MTTSNFRLGVIHISLVALSLIGVSKLNAQTWTRQSPYPADVDLLDVHFITENYGWISGHDDLLMFTTDGGSTWQQTTSVQRSPQFHEDPIWDVEFVNDQLGFAFGNNMYRTTDGGATWQDIGFLGSIYDGNDHRLRDVRVLDVDDAYIATIRPGAIYQGVIYRTTDGENWFELNPFSDPTNQAAGSVGQIDVLPTGEIWATGGIGFIWSSGIPEVGELAELVELQVATGTALDGTIAELNASDDAYVHTRSRFGETFIDLHHMELIVRAMTTVTAPTSFDSTIEDRIDKPTGTATIRLRNWSTGNFDVVESYVTNSTDAVHTLENIDATNYVDASGAIELSIKHIVFVPYLAFTFESFIDQIEIVAR